MRLTGPLPAGKAQLLFPQGGRPSNGTWPYFNIAWYGAGVMVALGWPGQWTAQVRLDEKQGLSLQAGMTSADPQQQLRQHKCCQVARYDSGSRRRSAPPPIVLMPWSANSWLWRRTSGGDG